MTVVPDWFQDNFVDMEQLLVEFFEKVFPSMGVGLWTPDDWLDQFAPDPELTVIRLPGGHVDYDKNYDEALMQVTGVTGDRDETVRIMSCVRSCLLPMRGFKFTMGDGFTALIHGCTEVSGPSMLTPEQMVDTRVIPVTFKVRVGLKSRARYESILRSL